MNAERDPDAGSSFILSRSALLPGLHLFNSHHFWHAHEAWEEHWLQAAGEPKIFLQGLIQLAAAYHHVQRGTFRGGARLFESSLRRLSGFPEGYAGVDRAEAVRVAQEHRERIARGEKIDASEFPKLYN